MEVSDSLAFGTFGVELRQGRYTQYAQFAQHARCMSELCQVSSSGKRLERKAWKTMALGPFGQFRPFSAHLVLKVFMPGIWLKIPLSAAACVGPAVAQGGQSPASPWGKWMTLEIP